MDFLTITNKLKNGDYGSKDDLAADVRLMCSNAYKYNQVPEAPAYLAAKEIEGLLDDRKWTLCRSSSGFNGENMQFCARLTTHPKNRRSRSKSRHPHLLHLSFPLPLLLLLLLRQHLLRQHLLHQLLTSALMSTMKSCRQRKYLSQNPLWKTILMMSTRCCLVQQLPPNINEKTKMQMVTLMTTWMLFSMMQQTRQKLLHVGLRQWLARSSRRRRS